jgi:hypothetical protein
MLIWIHVHGEIQNGTDCKSNDACYQSTNNGRLLALVKVSLFRYLYPAYRHIGGRTGADPPQVLGFCTPPESGSLNSDCRATPGSGLQLGPHELAGRIAREAEMVRH